VKVIVASTHVPFLDGGARVIVRDLVVALRERGHEVDTVDLPFLSDHRVMLEQMLAFRLFDLGDSADRLIAIRTPSYLLRHERKNVWFIHHHRGAYDLWGTEYQDLPTTPDGLRIRDAIMDADNLYLAEARGLFTNSATVGDRLRTFNGLESTVLYPPLGHPERFEAGPFGDYVFYPSRITHHKRQHLAIAAAALLKSDARIVIAGAPDEPGQLARLTKLVQDERLRDRVTLIPRWISEDEKAELIAGSLGILYIPFLEDSYGYVTLEAFQAHKPVITCSDSGGTLEVVRDGVNGLVVDPTAISVARGIDSLRGDLVRAGRMGEEGYRTIERHGISWPRVVEALLA
jgi:glycosyltransferase involved in cell wall biosynthesis